MRCRRRRRIRSCTPSAASRRSGTWRRTPSRPGKDQRSRPRVAAERTGNDDAKRGTQQQQRADQPVPAGAVGQTREDQQTHQCERLGRRATPQQPDRDRPDGRRARCPTLAGAVAGRARQAAAETVRGTERRRRCKCNATRRSKCAMGAYALSIQSSSRPNWYLESRDCHQMNSGAPMSSIAVKTIRQPVARPPAISTEGDLCGR
jgi:hypothetical protein